MEVFARLTLLPLIKPSLKPRNEYLSTEILLYFFTAKSTFLVFTLLGCLSAIADTNTGGKSSHKVALPTQAMLEANQRNYAPLINELIQNPIVGKAFSTMEADRKRNNDTLIEITEIPAPPFGEQNRARRFAQLLRNNGLTDVTIDAEGNVIGRRPGSRKHTEEPKTIALAAHLDTVFPIETDVTVKVEGDIYTAPGIGDNSRGLVVLLSLLRAMELNDIKTKADVLFIGNVGEEGLGDLRGVKHLYREGGPRIDAFISVDGNKARWLTYGGVGSYRYRVKVMGPGGHSWGAFGDANPHHALGRIIDLFAERALEVTQSGPKTSFNVGRIGGGTSINSIPFESWMEVDMRSGNEDKLKQIDVVFKQAIEDGLQAENNARLSGPELSVKIDKIGVRPAGLGDPESPLIQHAMAAMQALGINPKLTVSSTDSNIPISLGLPAITISRGGEGGDAHSLKETWVDKDSHTAIQIAMLIVLAQAGLAN